MKKKSDSTQESEKLRQRAEQELADHSNVATELQMIDAKRLLHELQVYQIELEMQNEALQQAKALLEISRDEYRNRFVDLYDFAPIGYLTVSDEDLITEINLTAASMLGIDRNKLILQSFPQWIADESRDDWQWHCQHLKQHRGKKSCEVIMRRRDGSTFYAKVDCCFAMGNEQMPSIRVAFSDITERKRAEKKLNDADRRKNEFLAMLAHELRNPLAPIRNAVEILKYAKCDTARSVWCTDVIDRQLKQMTQLVDDLLDVSRISRGLIELKKTTLEIRDVIKLAVETNQPLIDARRQEFTMLLPAEPLWLEGDLIRLTQVVSNLINNAVKFTQKGGRIGLTVELCGNDICIRVSDNGCGIDSANLVNLFDLFYQVDCNLDRSQGGLGIGLSLVRSLVEKHGGDVQAFSAGRGQGSEFVVRLPRLALAEPRTVFSSALPATASNKLRILVVDDNRDIAESLALLLNIEGYQVQTVNDGQAALEMTRAVRPDVILLDIGLPEMDGYSVAQELRRNGELMRTRLIAMTGYGQPEDRERSLAVGFDEHLVKPLNIEILLKLLNDYRVTAVYRP